MDTSQLKNWWIWKYLQHKYFLFESWSCKRIYQRKKNGNKYLILYDSAHENKEVLKKYADV